MHEERRRPLPLGDVLEGPSTGNRHATHSGHRQRYRVRGKRNTPPPRTNGRRESLPLVASGGAIPRVHGRKREHDHVVRHTLQLLPPLLTEFHRTEGDPHQPKDADRPTSVGDGRDEVLDQVAGQTESPESGVEPAEEEEDDQQDEEREEMAPPFGQEDDVDETLVEETAPPE